MMIKKIVGLTGVVVVTCLSAWWGVESKPYRPTVEPVGALVQRQGNQSRVYVYETIGPSPKRFYRNGKMTLDVSYTVSGSGDAGWDGDYPDSTLTYNGQPFFQLSPFNLLYYTGTGWALAQNLGGTVYYFNNGADPLTTTDAWQVDTGTPPAPTVTGATPPPSGGAAMISFAYRRRQ